MVNGLAGICSLELISWWERGKEQVRKQRTRQFQMLMAAQKDVQWGNMLAIDLDRVMLGLSEKSSLRCI